MVNHGIDRFAGSMFLLVAVITALTCIAPVGSTRAQDRVLRFEGRVAWITGNSMVVTLDNAPSVEIDLRRIPQAELRTIEPRDYVIVTGMVERPGRRVLAVSIQRVEAWYPQAP